MQNGSRIDCSAPSTDCIRVEKASGRITFIIVRPRRNGIERLFISRPRAIAGKKWANTIAQPTDIAIMSAMRM